MRKSLKRWKLDKAVFIRKPVKTKPITLLFVLKYQTNYLIHYYGSHLYNSRFTVSRPWQANQQIPSLYKLVTKVKETQEHKEVILFAFLGVEGTISNLTTTIQIISGNHRYHKNNIHSFF